MAMSIADVAEVTWAAGADPAAQNVSITSGVKAFCMIWTYYNGTAGRGLASCTLGGANPDTNVETPTAATDQAATGILVWLSPSTGTVSLNPAWDAAPAEGPTTSVFSISADGTISVVATGLANETGLTACSTTLTGIESGDLCLKHDQKFVDGTPPGNTTGWTSQLTGENNSEYFRLASIVATGTSQVCPSENDNYSTIAAIAFHETAGGAEEPRPRRLSLLGVG